MFYGLLRASGLSKRLENRGFERKLGFRRLGRDYVVKIREKSEVSKFVVLLCGFLFKSASKCENESVGLFGVSNRLVCVAVEIHETMLYMLFWSLRC